MQGYTIRPVRADEWERVRELRLRAVHDPVASVAFTDTVEHAEALPDDFWRDRAAGGSADAGPDATARQFVAEDATGRWIGTTTALREHAGENDYEDRPVPHDGCSVVGVYLDPAHRGKGVLAALFDAVEAWAAGPLRLSVHTDNARAVRAYEKLGFHPVGTVYTGVLGPTVEMRRP